MTDSTLRGFDVNALIQTAGAEPEGSQKLRFCKDVSDAIGANPIYEIQVGGVAKYRTTISGSLPYSSSGITLPTQFVEPPTVNVAADLDGGNVYEVIRSASNSALEIVTEINGSGGSVTADDDLDGSGTVRTSSRVLAPPSVLDVSVDPGESTGIYLVSTLIGDMTLANDNEWHIEAAPNTRNTNGPPGRYAYVQYGLNSANSNSHYPGEYLTDSTMGGRTMTDGQTIGWLPWYVVGRAAQDTTGASNTRVQLRAHKFYGLKSDNTWELINSDDTPITGASWHANFSSPTGGEMFEETTAGAGLAQIRSHSAGEGGGESIGSVGYGDDGSSVPRRYKWTVHGYNNGTFKTRAQWVAYKGILATIEARLILHDPNGTDDRSGAGLMMWIATGDIYYGSSFAGANWIGENAHGRLKLITSDWGLFSASDCSSTLLTNYPPPGFS